jgi:hypothetical protein
MPTARGWLRSRLPTILSFDLLRLRRTKVNLRQDARVREILELWWDTALRSMLIITDTMDARQQDEMIMRILEIPKINYARMLHKLYKVMVSPTIFDESFAAACAEEDIARDYGDIGVMDSSSFGDALFELATMWTATNQTADEISSFLWRLLGCVAAPRGAPNAPVRDAFTPLLWKADEDIKFDLVYEDWIDWILETPTQRAAATDCDAGASPQKSYSRAARISSNAPRLRAPLHRTTSTPASRRPSVTSPSSRRVSSDVLVGESSPLRRASVDLSNAVASTVSGMLSAVTPSSARVGPNKEPATTRRGRRSVDLSEESSVRRKSGRRTRSVDLADESSMRRQRGSKTGDADSTRSSKGDDGGAETGDVGATEKEEDGVTVKGDAVPNKDAVQRWRRRSSGKNKGKRASTGSTKTNGDT